MSSWKSPIDGLFSGGKGSGSPYKPKPRSGQKVERDGQGRIVRLTAVVNREDLNRGSDTNQAVRDYIRANLGADPKAHDAGHLLAKTLGGSGTCQDNIVPMTRNLNRGAYNRWEGVIKAFLAGTSPKDQADSDSCSDSDLATLERYRSNAEGGWVVVTIKLEYSDSTGVPAWIYYEANFFGRDGKEMVLPWESKIFFKNK